jgi:hypothetical protein
MGELNLEGKSGTVSKRRKKIAQQHKATSQKIWFLNTKTGFKLTHPFSAVSFPASNAANFPHDLAVCSF